MQGYASATIAVGDAVDVLLRPESIRIGDIDRLKNRFSARIEDIVYLGDGVSVKLIIAGTQHIIALLPADFDAAPGDEVTIGFSAENAWCLQ